MSDYTYGDIIINPTSEEAKNCICKEVYFSTAPNDCLKYANNDNKDHCGTLQSIVERNSLPFVILSNDSDSAIHVGASIILKRESEPEYVQFESANEFLTAYEDSIKNDADIRTNNDNRMYCFGGIWLRDRDTEIDIYCMVTEVRDNGVIISNRDMYTDRINVFNHITTWSELCESFTFLGGTPCGKLREVE